MGLMDSGRQQNAVEHGCQGDASSSGSIGSSSSSDSESESESGPILNPEETSEKKLTLVDDEESGLIICPPPEHDGEGRFEVEGEGTEGGGDIFPEKKRISVSGPECEKPKKKKKRKKKCLYCCTMSCKYESVRRCAKRFGFKEIGEDEDWHLFWTDYSVALERVMDMKKYQKINHFPGMSEICRKDLLARNMNRMLRLFPKEYNVFPRSWCLPADYGDFQAYARQKKHKTYILKPESGCQGKGIWVTKSTKDIKANEHMLCQQYVSRPFLIDGFKFDLRIYTLVTSCDPLRVFIFKDGLARFATVKYCDPHHHNVDNVYMHLTNYAINKNSTDFIRDDEAGSKRRISTINKWLIENGYDLDRIWNDIDDVIIKTLISAHGVLKHNYRTCFPNHVKGSACFEILGFDVMLDKKGKPYLIEVNHSPSFHTDAKLDKEIKETLLYDTLNLVNFGAIDKKKCIEEEKRKVKERLFQRQNKRETKEEYDKAQVAWLDTLTRYEDAHLGNFRRIYPSASTDAKYEKFFNSSGSLYQETAAFKARAECARQQREEIMRKQEKMDMMLKKKKSVELRPESPVSRRRRLRQGSVPFRRYNTARSLERESDKDKEYRVQYTLAKTIKPYQSLSAPSSTDLHSEPQEPLNTNVPVDIVEEEELERISGLLQRDNLVRGLGIVEHVYRLLHCTAGTMSVQLKASDKFNQKRRLPSLDPSLGEGRKRASFKTKLTSLAYEGPVPPECDTYQALPVRPKPLPLPDPASAPFSTPPVVPAAVPAPASAPAGAPAPAPHPPPQPHHTSLPDNATDIAPGFCHHHRATASVDHIANVKLALYHHRHQYDSASARLNPVHDGISVDSHGVITNNSYSNSSLSTLHATYNHALSRQVLAHGQSAYIGGQSSHIWKTSRQPTTLTSATDRALQRRGSLYLRGDHLVTGHQQDVDVENDSRNQSVYGRHGSDPRRRSARSVRTQSLSGRRWEGGGGFAPRYGGVGTSHVPNSTSALTGSACDMLGYASSFPLVRISPQYSATSPSVIKRSELTRKQVIVGDKIQPQMRGLKASHSSRQLDVGESYPGAVLI